MSNLKKLTQVKSKVTGTWFIYEKRYVR